jgi:hypothetical protein
MSKGVSLGRLLRVPHDCLLVERWKIEPDRAVTRVNGRLWPLSDLVPLKLRPAIEGIAGSASPKTYGVEA